MCGLEGYFHRWKWTEAGPWLCRPELSYYLPTEQGKGGTCATVTTHTRVRWTGAESFLISSTLPATAWRQSSFHSQTLLVTSHAGSGHTQEATVDDVDVNTLSHSHPYPTLSLSKPTLTSLAGLSTRPGHREGRHTAAGLTA